MITRLNGALNGLKGGHNSYDLLLTWNPTFPLIALNIRNEGKKKNYWIDWLGEESQEQKDTYALEESIAFGTSEIAGHFFIREFN
jgi:hypothetical protein